MAAPTDPVTMGLEELAARVVVWGSGLIALIVLAVGIFIGVRYLGYMITVSDPSPRGGKHHSSRPSIGKAWR